MKLHFLALLPGKKLLIDAKKNQRKATDKLRTFLLDARRQCAEYEASPSASYARTNTLKRSWSIEGPVKRGKMIEGAVLSSGQIAPYNRFVRGPKQGRKGKRQAERMAKRGWLSVDDIAVMQWKKHGGVIADALQGR